MCAAQHQQLPQQTSRTDGAATSGHRSRWSLTLISAKRLSYEQIQGIMATHNHCQQHPPPSTISSRNPSESRWTGYLSLAHKARTTHKSVCQMPCTRFVHLEGVGVEEGPADES